MADKLEGSAIVANTVSGDRIVTGSITTTQLAPSVANFVNEGKPLKIQTITYPGNDTAANTGGGQTIILSGSGFKQNVQVYINSNAVPSVTYANANAISFTAPALAAATYPIYVINTDDGATAILIPGIQYSGTPTWTTSTPLTTQDASIAWNIQLVATSDSTVSYSLQAGSSLPAGITLAANGLISGTMSSPPADETTYNFTVVANDLENQDASRAFSVSVTVAVLDPYFTYTTLLLHGDGTNNANNHAFVDSSNNAFTITRYGNASQGTFSPFGDNWSYYFDGSGDYFTLPTSLMDNITSSAASFTMEAWVNLASYGSPSQPYYSRSILSKGQIYLNFCINGSGALLLYHYDGSATRSTTSTGIVPLNQWTHVAAVVNGSGTITYYINGVASGTATWYGHTGSGQIARIGSTQDVNAGGSSDWLGYISNLRFCTGQIYTSAFTPPTTPLTPVSNTSLLTCQSNAFIDESPSRLVLTRAGDVRVSKFDPFKPYKAIPASYGVYFDGTGDYLTAPANSAFALSGDFTIEFWVRTSSFDINTYYRRMICFGQDAADNLQLLFFNGSAATSNLGVYSNSLLISGTIPVADGTWHHIALCRSGSSLRLFVDGTQSGSTATTSQNFSAGSTNGMFIGRYALDGGYLLGHMSNLRVLKGTALYTTTFTPPTAALTAVANTSLLTCQSTTIIDNSTNAFTITRNGDARPTDLNPFTTTFVSEKYNTANGGGSLYCDGTGDYLTLADNAAFTVGSDDFTVDFWIYNNTTGARRFIYGQSNSGGQNVNIPFSIYKNSSNKLQFDVFASGSGTQYSATSSADLPLNQWVYVACVRNGTTTRIYINGVQDGTNATISTITLVDSSNLLGIGCIGEVTSDTWLGYISNLRFIKGTCLYPSGTPFILPTSPVTAIANTQLLCNFTNAGIIDSVGKNVLETVGGAKVNTSVKKYGTGSMYFDGSSYLAVPWDEYWNIGSGDYTVECWIKTSDTVGEIVSAFNQNSPYPGWLFGIGFGNNNGKLTFYNANGSNSETKVSGLTVNDDNWHHVAMTKVGTSLRFFIDGLLDSTHTLSYVGTGSNQAIRIGADNNTSPSRYLIGYIDDLRITKGVARYRYNFTPPTKAFNDGDGSLANNTTDVLVGDQVNLPVFPYTTLLLHGDGTNNANNHAFLDSSNNAFAITRNGNATQGTFSPFSPTGWSMYQSDINVAYPSFTTSVGSAFQFTGNFTIEAWVYPVSYSGTGDTSLWVTYDNVSYLALNYDASGNYNIYLNSGSPTSTFSSGISTNQWNHVAMVRSGSTVTLYTNGVARGTISNSSTIGHANPSLARIGGGAASNVRYVSNLRIVKGTAVYTANFTPPTAPLTAVANTQLLTCQSNRFVDNSNNNFIATLTGSPSIQAFSPFAPSVEYTANTHGGSAYFDGTGDYLTATLTSQAPGTGDFTYQFWVYAVDNTAVSLFDTRAVNNNTTGFTLLINGTSNLAIYTSSTILTGSGTVPLNAWSFITVTRSGTTLTIYLNETSQGTVTFSNNLTDTAMRLGQYVDGTGSFTGYIAGFKYVKGSADSASVPTTPPTATTGTQFLCSFTNAGILDSTGKNVLETVGDAKVNTAIKKYGTGSMYFDGTGDYLLTNATSTQQFAFGTGDFTIECWLYRSASATYQVIFDFRKDSSTDVAPLIYLVSGVPYYYTAGGDRITGSAAITNNTWVHLALCRSGTSTKLFVDGNQSGATYTDSNNYVGKSGRPIIGVEGVSIGASPYTGYIDDLRITKGIARYVQNFTPPTAAFLNK